MAKSRRQSTLYRTIYEMVGKVPKGKVATYGQIAHMCNLRGHARLVGYALHNLPPSSCVPWHRIVNAKGMISLPRRTGGYERQKRLLEQEGVRFVGEKIELSRHGVSTQRGKKK